MMKYFVKMTFMNKVAATLTSAGKQSRRKAAACHGDFLGWAHGVDGMLVEGDDGLRDLLGMMQRSCAEMSTEGCPSLHLCLRAGIITVFYYPSTKPNPVTLALFQVDAVRSELRGGEVTIQSKSTKNNQYNYGYRN